MENASEALMMAFGVLIFVLALTVAMNSFNQVKSVSDVVLYTADKTNFYDYQEATGASQNRIVGLETIIPTLYKYYKENYTVLFRKGKYVVDENGNYSITKTEPLYIYKTISTQALWKENYEELLEKKYSPYFDSGDYGKKQDKIFSFDLDEETLRHEPWTGMYYKARENLNCFLKGGEYVDPSGNNKVYKYTTNFINEYSKAKFVETIGEYSYDMQEIDNNEENYGLNLEGNKKKKRIVIFTLIK